MDLKCKRIIEGKTYNTETATQLGGWSDDERMYPSGCYLYQNRLGVFFEYSFLDADEDSYEHITPKSPEEARKWLEERCSWKPELIEALFGEMPEAGSGESKYTLRMPDSLKDRLAARAKANNQSLNAWIVRCLETCATRGHD